MYDLILKGGNILDVRSLRIYVGDVLIKDGIISGVGTSQNQKAKRIIDISGKYVSPGLIDSHLHIESSLLSPLEFSKQAVKHGTTALFVDPHEIANVLGKKGIELFLKQADLTPLDMFIGIPSCVPATPLENSGASITVEDVKELLADRRVFGLAEMMNFPGIIHNLGDAREKVDLVFNAGKIIDGHCPGVSGERLRLYMTNGKDDGTVRIMSDHESTHLDEVMEKNRLGMTIALRLGSATKDLERILPGLLKENVSLERFMVCSDDLDPIELFEEGHVDRIIRRARKIIQTNTDSSLEEATLLSLSLATINPSQYFSKFFMLQSYPETGEIAQGKKANLVIFNSIQDLSIDQVIHNGVVAVNEGEYVREDLSFDYSQFMGKVNPGKTFLPEDFKIKFSGDRTPPKVRVIGIIANSLLTEEKRLFLPALNNELKSDPEKDIVKIAVIERHKGTGSYSLGFVQGLGIRAGAIASTVAHDSHNLIVAGVDEESMAKAVNFLSEKGGGMAVVADRVDYFPLQIGGLMSTLDLEKVVNDYKKIKKAVRQVGSPLENTFMTMAFLALPVIPKLKITDRGLVDVEKFDFVNVTEI